MMFRSRSLDVVELLKSLGRFPDEAIESSCAPCLTRHLEPLRRLPGVHGTSIS